MKAWIWKAAALFAIWLILSASHRPTDIALGVLVALGVVWLNPADPESQFRRVGWLGIAGYLPWLFGRILRSGIHLTRLILDPSLPIAPKLIHHRADLRRDGEVVLLGNSITLTPGTITVEIDSNELLVHAIDDSSALDLTEGRLERKIHKVFPRQ